MGILKIVRSLINKKTPFLWSAFAFIVITLMPIGHAEDHAEPKVESSPSPGPSPSPVAAQRALPTSKNSLGCIVDEQAVEDLRAKRSELIELEKKLSARESELSAKEVALNEQIKKIDQIRSEIKKTHDVASKEDLEKINKIVETFEAMSPKSIAAVVTKLDERLAVIAMGKMSTGKLAKLLGALESSKASRLSELMAGVTAAKSSQEPSLSGSPVTK